MGRDDFLKCEGLKREADITAWIDSTRVSQSPMRLLGEDVVAVHEFVDLVRAPKPGADRSLTRAAPAYYSLPLSACDFVEREERWNGAMLDSLLETRTAFMWGHVSVAWRMSSDGGVWCVDNLQSLEQASVTYRDDVKHMVLRHCGDVLITTRLTPRTRKLRCYELRALEKKHECDHRIYIRSSIRATGSGGCQHGVTLSVQPRSRQRGRAGE
jgi:hypothetical protein